MPIVQYPSFPDQQMLVDELFSLALVVAKTQRGEDHLQSQEVIKGKFLAEMVELDEAIETKTRVEVLSEIADLVYYSVQDFAVGAGEQDLHATVEYLALKVHISVEEAYIVALTKYRLRAYNSKDFEKENEAIAKLGF